MSAQLPIWFQSVKEASALKSGIMNIPMIAVFALCSLLGGSAVNITGQYLPLMYLGTIIASIGCGMLTTMTATSGHLEWIGYQILFAIGAGLGFNLPVIAVQASLPPESIATATAIIMFAQNLSGALFIAIAQNLFQNRLVSSVVHYAPSVPVSDVIAAGAANLAGSFPQAVLPSLKQAYNVAITQTFYISVATSGLSIVGVAFMPWLSVKQSSKSTNPTAMH